MFVFDYDNNSLGQCTVKNRQLIGAWFVVSLAIEGEWCQACMMRHTHFKEVKFKICIYGQWRLGLIADDLEAAKHLPGFRSHDDTLP